MRPVSRWSGLLCIAALAGLPGCRFFEAKPKGVLLITLDTTRADHLGSYGYAGAATANLDALAKESVRFDQAMAPVPTTLPSHATMFTGLYPPTHGVRYNGMFQLGPASVTLAERLHDAGFATGAVPAAYPVYAKSGLDQGFDTYNDMFADTTKRLPANAERNAADVVKLGLETIHAAGTKPFFVWLHFYEPHYPYTPPFPFSAKFRDHPYDGEIGYVDKQLGELFAALKKDGLWDRLVVVVAGDHGEGLYEHGERMHSTLAYQSTLRVPLLVKAPGVDAGLVVPEPVTLADLTPTILDLVGLPVPDGLDGVSLRRVLRGATPPDRPIYFESLAGSLSFGWSPLEGVRRGKWKLIRGKTSELYDLDADPAELHDLHASEGDTVARLTASLDQSLERWKDFAAADTAIHAPVDADALARLAALGYVGGGMTSARRNGPNPVSLVHLESELLLLQDLMVKRQCQRAMLAIPDILRDDENNRVALQDAAECSALLSQFEDAERYARKAIAVYPEFLPPVVTLGRVQVAKKDYKGAEREFRAGLARFKDEPILMYSLALSLIADQRAAEAEPVVAKALEAKNPDPSFQILRALCRAIADDPEAALAALKSGIASGYQAIDVLRNEPLMAPLRDVPGFPEAIAPPKKAS